MLYKKLLFCSAQCDHCARLSHPMFHLKMSDTTMRNFCSYECVTTFQSELSKKSLTLDDPENLPLPTGATKLSIENQKNKIGKSNCNYLYVYLKQNRLIYADQSAPPIIRNVQSLAPLTNGADVTLPRSKSNTLAIPKVHATTETKQYVSMKPSPLPEANSNTNGRDNQTGMSRSYG